MTPRPLAVAFDVIGTVFSLETLRERLAGVGLPGETLETWFAQTLRDAFALEVTGVYKPFKEIASGTLKSLLELQESPADPETIESILGGFAELTPHPDAAPAFAALRKAGIRICTLTNGSAEVTQKLLKSSKLDELVERTISIDEVRHWKPRREVYLHAAGCMGLEPHQMALVATHFWDVHGAARAGLIAAFVARSRSFPRAMAQPDFSGDTLEILAGDLVRAE